MFDTPVLPLMALFFSTAAVLILRGPLGKALAERVSGRVGSSDVEVKELRDELDEVRAELAAVHERLDFAERLLARQPGGNLVSPGGGGGV